MTSREDLESYLLRMGVEYEEVDEAMWRLKPTGNDTTEVVMSFAPPVVLLGLKVLHLPEEADEVENGDCGRGDVRQRSSVEHLLRHRDLFAAGEKPARLQFLERAARGVEFNR